MGAYVIRTPDIGEGIAEVELVAWHVQPGDAVREDQVLADVMTDKATVEIPSPVSGTVRELAGQPGSMVAVGSSLVLLEVDGPGNLRGTAVTDSAHQGGAAQAAVEAGPAQPRAAKQPEAPVAAERPAPRQPLEGPAARQPPSRPPVEVPAAMRAVDEKPLASPAVRQRARELDIDLRRVHGSGPAGRVERRDLEVYLAARGQPGAGRPGDAVQQVPLSPMRRRIAQRMQEAKRRIPHFSYVEEVDVTELEALRARLNAKFSAQRGKLTLLPLIARAVTRAVADFPQMNARFDDEAGVVERHSAVHLGIATQTGAGLMVPVVRDAGALDPWAFAAEVARLAEAARAGRVTREQLSGSTLTITSLGPLGGLVTTPVINAPEVAIVGVNRIVERPMLRAGQVAARQLMNLSSSFDHRVVDGMEAAEFIQAVRSLLETPALLFVD